ncbi:UAA transporter [Tulasnella sp. 419]|nr:UAA transporter [Tulasnella sp. 419]
MLSVSTACVKAYETLSAPGSPFGSPLSSPRSPGWIPLPHDPDPEAMKEDTMIDHEYQFVKRSKEYIDSVLDPLASLSFPKERVLKMLDSPASWLILYFICNLGLTLCNKGILVHFPFPYTLTALHALCGTIGCISLWSAGYFSPARLTARENLILSLFSTLYTLNITVSNVSLRLVSVPFHQVVRASTPFFTILISYSIFRRRGKGFLGVGTRKLMTLFPIMAGVGFATYGDYSFTLSSFYLTLFGTFLAALKTVVTNILQTSPISQNPALHHHARVPSIRLNGVSESKHRPTLSVSAPPPSRLKLHPLDLLLRMSPMAFVQCLIYAYFTGEAERLRIYAAHEMGYQKAMALILNGCIAFTLNVVSFTANKKTGPLTMTVAANVKQVLTILLAVTVFNIQLSPTNSIGILLTLIGGAWYASVEYKEKMSSSGRPASRRNS